jgi:membrane-associated tyrosine/threonine-specific cdc2-inhibitory kinase
MVWAYLVDLLLALEHLHDNDLIHMDVKPENIFIGRDGICKLGDFGLVIDLAKDPANALNALGTIGGDSKYMAGEILQGTYTKACDVFSLGES